MKWLRRKQSPAAPLVSVVVPAYGVEEYLDECLASLVAQTHPRWEAVVVDDGALDRTGAIADAWAAREPRIRVVHSANGGLGAARNLGVAHADPAAKYLTFLDSDDVLPADAFALLVASLEASGSDMATGSIVRWESDGLHEPPWMRRLHRPARSGIGAAEHPEILGDVFAWNKMWRHSWWREQGLAWPERIRYEDQPTTTESFLRARFDVLDSIVYHWRIRADGTSITQQRASITDLADRWETKRMALASVRTLGTADIESVFVERVLAGDLWRYFTLIPGCDDEWWSALRSGVLEFWGARGLLDSGLPPVHRLAGWLVAADRRADAEALMGWAATLAGPAPRAVGADGTVALAIPASVLDSSSVEAAALAVRPHEV